MAKAPTTRKAPRAKAAPAAAAAPATINGASADTAASGPPATTDAATTAPTTPAHPGAADAIRMLVGQEGPNVSRDRGQELTIGTDIGADEAQRLIDAEFAERV